MEHNISCWNCSTPYDAFEATWCGCSVSHPSKICPFCYTCACSAPASYLQEYWAALPDELRQDVGKQGQPKKRIGELLVERGRITSDQLAELLEQQRSTGVRLGDILVNQGLASREEVSRHVAEQQDLQFVELDPKNLNVPLILSVGAKTCLQHSLVPLDSQELGHYKLLIVAVAEPITPDELEKLGEKLACKLYQKFASPLQVRQALDRIKKILLLSRNKQQQAQQAQQQAQQQQQPRT